MSRRTARRYAFQLVYQMSFFARDEFPEVSNIFFSEREIGEEDREFIEKTASGTIKNLDKIDELINQNARKWSVQRMSRVDAAIMRIAVYEMLEPGGAPLEVSLNEAVELAKRFGDDTSGGFVNGVLGAIEKSLRAENP